MSSSSGDDSAIQPPFASATRLVLVSEWVLSVTASLLAIAFHTLFFLRAGPLWRDEVNSVNIASLPDISQIWANLQYDSFPPGWLMSLHGWISVTHPEDDRGFRLLGLTIGLTLVVVVWLTGFDMTRRPPVIAISLLLLSASVIRFGDSIRGYGLGMLSGVACIWVLHRAATREHLGWHAFAAFVSTCAVQLLYYNVVIVFSACIAAAVVAVKGRSIRRAVLALAVGGVAAGSLLPILPTIRAVSSWNDLVRYDVGLGWLFHMWRSTIASSGAGVLVLWYGILALATALGVVTLVLAARGRALHDSPVFHATLLIVGGSCYVGFLLSLSYITAPWYYLAFLVITAVASDALLSAWLSPRARLLMLALLVAGLATSIDDTTSFVATRATNVDQAAAFLDETATRDDLIVVVPWEVSLTLDRHLKGDAPWETVPPLGRVRWHRYDLFMEALQSPDTTLALDDRIVQTLASGHRVFVVLNITSPPPEGMEWPEAKIPEQGLPARSLYATLVGSGYAIRDCVHLRPATEFETVRVLEVTDPRQP